MAQVKVIGAGSIGNHLTHACRGLGWQVTLCDQDPQALRRSREQIYPARYGAWDPEIRTAGAEEIARDPFDLVIVGTPPDTHMPVALRQIRDAAPRLLLIEKPLCAPDLAGVDTLQSEAARAGCTVLVGFNHTLTANTRFAEQWLHTAPTGAPLALHAATLEHWGGILQAHPWLRGPADTYLGFTRRGGGAIGEHCHAINLWQHFAHLCGQGRILEVTATLDWVADQGANYDRQALLQVRTEQGLVGTIAQDVVTRPATKQVSIAFENGHLQWQASADPHHDAVLYRAGDQALTEHRIAKSRPDDFAGEARHLADLLADPSLVSPISLQRGADTMLVIAAALKSDAERRVVRIDYGAGYRAAALD